MNIDIVAVPEHLEQATVAGRQVHRTKASPIQLSLGGDEFVSLLGSCGIEENVDVGERVFGAALLSLQSARLIWSGSF